ncbi:hypothetical protein BH24ACT22_BH24ACT22_16700 [soil metagenome]
MLKKLNESAGNVLGYEVKGKLTEKEFEALSVELKAVIAEHGKVRLLVRMPEMPGVEFGALVEDLKLAKYANDIERCALVGDATLLEWAEKLGNPLIGGEDEAFRGFTAL